MNDANSDLLSFDTKSSLDPNQFQRIGNKLQLTTNIFYLVEKYFIFQFYSPELVVTEAINYKIY